MARSRYETLSEKADEVLHTPSNAIVHNGRSRVKPLHCHSATAAGPRASVS